MNEYGDIAQLDYPADESGMVYIKIDGEYKLVNYDDFIKEYRYLPTSPTKENT